MSIPRIIAIDGESASGKSTVASMLAEKFGYLYFDTGVMYRAVTLAALNKQIPIADEEAVSALALTIDIKVKPLTINDGRKYDVCLEGEDVTWQIRSPEVDNQVSYVAAYPRVRDAVNAQLRVIARAGKLVMVGRDIGTVVLPDAELKLFLTASAEERARRRFLEKEKQNSAISYEEILASMTRRDKIDSSRDVAPSRPAEDAVVINTDRLSIPKLMSKVEALVLK